MAVLKKLIESRDALAVELRDLVGTEEEPKALTTDTESRALELHSEIKELDGRIKEESKREARDKAIAKARRAIEKEERKSSESDVQVTDEPMVYGVDSPHSYIADLVYVGAGNLFGRTLPGAQERLATWAHQVEREIANGTKGGREALKQIREQARTENGIEARLAEDAARERGRTAQDQKEFRLAQGSPAETRALGSGAGASAAASGGGAAFVTPVFFVADYAPFREPGREFLDQTNKQPLPPYGMNVYMPYVSGKAGIATQPGEGQPYELDPTVGYLSAGMVTKMGNVVVNQQLLDRAGPNFAFDQLVFRQLYIDLAPNLDNYTLTQALAAAGTQTFTSASWAFTAQPGTASFVSKIAGAINTIETTQGTIQSPTHIFVQPSRWNFIESVGALESTAGNLHPLLVPGRNGPFNAYIASQGDGFVPYQGDTGYKLFGLPIYKDLNIPTPAAGADQAIVGNLKEIYSYEGPAVPRIIPQTFAQNLQVLVQLYQYIAVLVRYPSAIQTVNGTGMAAITF